MVGELILNPHRSEPFRRIQGLLSADAASADPVLGADTHQRLMPLWKEQPQAGTLRRVGPGLRAVAAKLQPPYLYEWIRSPRGLRPTTRMPHSFGLWDHLDAQGRAVAQRFEPLEIRSMVTYLVGRSEAFNYAESEATSPSSPAEKAARGRVVFQERGCLACHTHRDFPDTAAYRPADEIVPGSDLSDLSNKLAHEGGRRWLYSWIKQPTSYHPRTLMPQTFLDPVKHDDGTVTDPADDVVEYLLASAVSAWQPDPQTLAALGPLDPDRQQTLNELTVENLRDTFSPSLAKEYATKGIPAEALRGIRWRRGGIGPAPRTAAADSFAVSIDQKLHYVGRKSLARYGCVACHDMPKLEDAKPIGPALSDWGRKDERQLAFESVVPYLDGIRPGAEPRLGGDSWVLSPSDPSGASCRIRVPEAPRAAKLRLSPDGEQALHRTVADAAVPIQRRGSRSDYHVPLGSGR